MINQTLFVKLFLGVTVVAIGGILLYQYLPIQKNGSHVDIPSIGADADYGKDFKTYTSDSGFSFKYPPHLEVVYRPDIMPNWIALTPNDDEVGGAQRAIFISTGMNDENMTPEEWLLSPDSGYDGLKPYYKTQIDGRDAVYTQGGMWVVVNTPDDKTRLSLATTEAGWDLFTEMGIVVESLTFDQ